MGVVVQATYMPGWDGMNETNEPKTDKQNNTPPAAPCGPWTLTQGRIDSPRGLAPFWGARPWVGMVRALRPPGTPKANKYYVYVFIISIF